MAEIIGTLKERQSQLLARPFGAYGEAEYFDELVGKKVIIVGSAGYLEGLGKGEWIDDFDVVVRVNHALPIENIEDLGEKTTVLYHILSHRGQGAKTVVTKEEVDSWDCEWIVSRHALRSSRIRRVGAYLEGRKWTAMSHEFYYTVRREVGRLAPNTGISAIAHLLQSELKSLNVIGFDMYRSGVYTGYGDVKKGEVASEVNDRWHDANAQLRYLSVLKRRDDRLKFDKVLQDLVDESISGRS